MTRYAVQLGIGRNVLTGPDSTVCQQVGSTLHALGTQNCNAGERCEPETVCQGSQDSGMVR